MWTLPNSYDTKAFLKKIRDRLRDACWDLYGSRLSVPDLVERPRTILFLCKGNICRSPFAERFARQQVGDSKMTFRSAGVNVSAPNPPPSAAVAAAQQFAVHMADHRSQPLTKEMMIEADMVIVMEISQFIQLKKQFPQEADKIYPLAHFQNQEKTPSRGYEKYNIGDPYGGTLDDFIYCYERIARCLAFMVTSGR